MAVTQSSSDTNSKQSVEARAQPSGRDGEDAAPHGPTRPRKLDGPSTGHWEISRDPGGPLKRRKLGRNRTKGSETDSLSDIDDAEVVGYLNRKEDINLKKFLWEAMNEKYITAKKQKQKAKTRKDAHVKKATKTIEKAELKRPSSRINYDALKLLDDDLEQGSEATQVIAADSSRTNDSSNGNISHGLRNDDEDEYGTSYGKDNGTFGHDDGDMYYEYGDDGDELFNDDQYFDF